MSLSFLKMHGAGNDFAIFDARKNAVRFLPGQIEAIASRSNPVTHGCDQVIVMEPSQKADVFMRIYNADGSEVNACGNATRCIGWFIMREKNTDSASVETNADILRCTKNLLGAGMDGWKKADGLIAADMGKPRLGWQDIPLAEENDTNHVKLEIEGLDDAACVSMGNPHVVFFVKSEKGLGKIETVGEKLNKQHALFPEGVNVSIAFISGDHVLMRVYERGVGLTASCGTAACAVEVAATRRGLLTTGKHHTLRLRGDTQTQMLMTWQEGGHVFLHGPVQREFPDWVPL